MNFRSYTSYISGNEDKALEIRLLRRFGGFSVLCKVFSSGALLYIRQKDRIPTPAPSLPKGGGIEANPFIYDRRTKEHNTPSLREGWGGLHIIPNPYPREGSVDGWGKYGLRSSLLAFKTKWRKKGQDKSAQGNALGIVRNQHSPRMGKRIIIPFTPFATL